MTPLPPEIERAVHTLETTKDFQAGEAAFKAVSAFTRADRTGRLRFWLEGAALLALLGLGVTFALFNAQGRDPLLGGILIGLALSVGVARFAFRKSPHARIEAAKNRWRPVAGTLAVQRTP